MHIRGFIIFVVVVYFFILFVVNLIGLTFSSDFLHHSFNGINNKFTGVVIERVKEIHDDQADEDDFDDGEHWVQTIKLAVV